MDDASNLLFVNSSQPTQSGGNPVKDFSPNPCAKSRSKDVHTDVEESSESNTSYCGGKLFFFYQDVDGEVSESNDVGKRLILKSYCLGNLSQGESSLQQNGSHGTSVEISGESFSARGLPHAALHVQASNESAGILDLDAGQVCISNSYLPDDYLQETSPSAGVFGPNREQVQEDDSFLQVDVVSISSDIVSSSETDITSSRDARRNSRRLFWDAFSRHSSRRLMDSSALHISSNDSDNMGSRGGRWLLDFNGDLFDDIGSSSGYLGNRIHSMNEQRRQSRSEVV